MHGPYMTRRTQTTWLRPQPGSPAARRSSFLPLFTVTADANRFNPLTRLDFAYSSAVVELYWNIFVSIFHDVGETMGSKLFLLFLCFILVTGACAQTTATIVGTVTDSSGAV